VVADRLRFEVYGRFRVNLHREEDGWWVAERLGADGKRSVLPEVVVPPDADPQQIADHLEAMFHEWARPGTRISRIDEAGGPGST